ncbi:MAG: hypothetical protein FJ386_11775 [Verrucomicrobia bacterium]|nr:hypothetical protein [Verrucomicrobiota bacterium]
MITNLLERRFDLRANDTSVRTELLAGTTTFLTMAYIIFVQPAVLSGAMMLRSVTRIAWDDYTECVPAFLVMVGIPFGYSIGDGLALGFIAYPVVKCLAGCGCELKWPVIVVALLMLTCFVLGRGSVG